MLEEKMLKNISSLIVNRTYNYIFIFLFWCVVIVYYTYKVVIGCYLLSISFLFNCYHLEFFFICSSYFTFQCYGSVPFKHKISPKECRKQKYHNYCHADVPSCVLKMVSHNLYSKIKILLAETCSLVFSQFR